jgi:hypothetical protein
MTPYAANSLYGVSGKPSCTMIRLPSAGVMPSKR